MYFVNTYVGPHNILENEVPFVDLNGENHGEQLMAGFAVK